MVALLLLSFIVYMFERLHTKIKKLRIYLQKDMLINNFIGLFYSTYLDFLIAAYFTVKFGAIDGNFGPYTNFYGEIISLGIASITILVACLVIPLICVIIIVTRKYDKSLEKRV